MIALKRCYFLRVIKVILCSHTSMFYKWNTLMSFSSTAPACLLCLIIFFSILSLCTRVSIHQSSKFSCIQGSFLAPHLMVAACRNPAEVFCGGGCQRSFLHCQWEVIFREAKNAGEEQQQKENQKQAVWAGNRPALSTLSMHHDRQVMVTAKAKKGGGGESAAKSNAARSMPSWTAH